MPESIKPRETALQVLMEVESKGAYSNLALGAFLDKLEPGKQDRAFITELVYGTLRSLNTLDWALGKFLRHPIDGLPVTIRNILRLGAYQLLYMDRVPDSAAVNESVNLARRYGHAGTVKLVNGVLRNLARGKNEINYPDPGKDPVGYISIRHSHPKWLVRRWLAEYGFEGTEALCRANNLPATNTVRVNLLKTSEELLLFQLEKLGIKARKGKYAKHCLHLEGFFSLGKMESFRQGLFQVQDESSILAGQAVNPTPGSRVIDVAAAPGGKSTHLAQIMQNKGEIIAIDVHEHKIKLIRQNCRRLGVEIVQPLLVDARDLPESYNQWADYVLVDAPCSGLGVLRRRPDARWRKKEEQIYELAELQKQILDSVAAAVKPGGVLVYSTCTITEEENTCQVKSFLAAHPEFKLEPLTGLLPESLDHRDTMKDGYLQILPHVHEGLDGFFIARMSKKKN